MEMNRGPEILSLTLFICVLLFLFGERNIPALSNVKLLEGFETFAERVRTHIRNMVPIKCPTSHTPIPSKSKMLKDNGLSNIYEKVV